MQISQKTILEMLGREHVRYVIPLYQRSYAWGRTQAADLLDDLARAGALGKAHFLGTFLYNSEPSEDGAELRVVIDGQQRITTVSLLVLALTEIIGKGETASSSQLPQANQLRARYVQEPISQSCGWAKPTTRRFARSCCKSPCPMMPPRESSRCIAISCGV